MNYRPIYDPTADVPIPGPGTRKYNEMELRSIREQIQEDICSYASVIDDEKLFFTDKVLNELCDIVVSNFEKLLKK